MRAYATAHVSGACKGTGGERKNGKGAWDVSAWCRWRHACVTSGCSKGGRPARQARREGDAGRRWWCLSEPASLRASKASSLRRSLGVQFQSQIWNRRRPRDVVDALACPAMLRRLRNYGWLRCGLLRSEVGQVRGRRKSTRRVQPSWKNKRRAGKNPCAHHSTARKLVPQIGKICSCSKSRVGIAVAWP